MIKIQIIVDEGKAYYNFEDEDVKLSDVGTMMFHLEKAKDYLKGFEFDSEFELKEGYDEE